MRHSSFSWVVRSFWVCRRVAGRGRAPRGGSGMLMHSRGVLSVVTARLIWRRARECYGCYEGVEVTGKRLGKPMVTVRGD